MPPFAQWCAHRHASVAGCDITLHTNTVLAGSRFEQFEKHVTCMVQRVDLAVLATLERYGGWYFDLDVVAIAPISEYRRYIDDLGGRAVVATQRTGGRNRCNNNVMYIDRDSSHVFEEMERYLSRDVDRFKVRAHVGPDLLNYLRDVGMTVEIPPEAVNPWGTSVSAISALESLIRGGEAALTQHWADHGKPQPLSFHLWGIDSCMLRSLGFVKGGLA